MPTTAGPSTSITLATARRTPCPSYRLASPSRSSMASALPVLTPDGTIAMPRDEAPRPLLAQTTSASTVGFPRLSSTSRANTRSMAATDMRGARFRSPSPRGERAGVRGDDGHDGARSAALPFHLLGNNRLRRRGPDARAAQLAHLHGVGVGPHAAGGFDLHL